MAATPKPSEDFKWASNDNPLDVKEPTAGLKASGIVAGSVPGREHFNWLFRVLGKMYDWVKAYAMDRGANLADLDDKAESRVNLGCNNAANLTVGTIPSARLPNSTVTLNGDVIGSATMTNLGSATITATVGNDSHTHSVATLPAGTTSNVGLVQLTDSVSSTSTTTAATPKSVKQAYDVANNKLSKSANLSDLTSRSAARNALGLYYVETENPGTGVNRSDIPGVSVSRVPGSSVGQFRITHSLGQCIPTPSVKISSFNNDHNINVLANNTSYTDVVINDGTSEVDQGFYVTFLVV